MNLDLATQLCVRFEGFRAKPYLCPAGVPTIGYGSTYYPGGHKVSLSDPPISEAQARLMLTHELLHTYAPAVIRLCPGLLPLAYLTDDWRRFCAIVDFAYNLGAGNLQVSTLRKRINALDWPGACVELAKWVKAGGRVLPGLVLRRAAEVELMN